MDSHGESTDAADERGQLPDAVDSLRHSSGPIRSMASARHRLPKSGGFGLRVLRDSGSIVTEQPFQEGDSTWDLRGSVPFLNGFQNRAANNVPRMRNCRASIRPYIFRS